MKFLTRLGSTIVLIPSTITTIFLFIFINSSISNSTDLSRSEILILRLASVVFAFVIGLTLAFLIISIILRLSKSTTSDFQTIYPNDQEIDIYVRTSQEEKISADEHLKHKIVSTSGTLKLKKNDSIISQSIDKIEYLGSNSKDSKVEKIEYSETIYDGSLFGLQLLNNFKSTRLKIYLTDSKTKENQQTEDELKSLLHGN